MSVTLWEKLAKRKTFKPTKRNYNTPEFYRQNPDLAPRNIYLREGRLITEKDIKKTLKRLERIEAIENFWNTFSAKLKQISQLFRIKKD